MSLSIRSRSMRVMALALFLALLATCLIPGIARAQEQDKIVRVGWYESQFNTTDELGRRSGYAYDYQQKLAAYTGWTYEYVDGSWADLLQMLMDGKIDLLSDVSYTEERAERIQYSSLPMGAESYFLYASPSNQAIVPDDFATFNGKKVGVQRGSIQIGIFRSWAQANGIEAELVELGGSEEENITKLARGDFDLYLSVGGFFDTTSAVPICKVGSSDFFFAVSKSRPELLVELNHAMNRIQDENQYYNQQLTAKYLSKSSVSNYLNTSERAWLTDHGAIRVGYQDNYLAFCAQDPKTGELIGALGEYLNVASDCLENAHLDFVPVCYPTSAAAMEALQNGEIDCAFPTNLTAYDGERLGVFVTPSLMTTDMAAVIRKTDLKTFAGKERVTVAVNADNPNYDMFLLDHFPDWQPIYFADTQECLKAVADGQADCLLISSYRYNNIAKTCEQYGLTTHSTGVGMDYCLAVNRTDTILYSILTKITDTVPASTVDAALAHYFTEDAKHGASEALSQGQLFAIVCVLAVAVAILLGLLLRSVWLRRKSIASQQDAPTKEDFALFDDLPLSYSVYRVTHAEHSELYDAEVIYVNHAFEALGGLPAKAVLGHRVRDLYPYVPEEWYLSVKRAASDGEPVAYDYTDPFGGKTFQCTVQRVICPGYCAVTYLEKQA